MYCIYLYICQAPTGAHKDIMNLPPISSYILLSTHTQNWKFWSLWKLNHKKYFRLLHFEWPRCDRDFCWKGFGVVSEQVFRCFLRKSVYIKKYIETSKLGHFAWMNHLVVISFLSLKHEEWKKNNHFSAFASKDRETGWDFNFFTSFTCEKKGTKRYFLEIHLTWIDKFIIQAFERLKIFYLNLTLKKEGHFNIWNLVGSHLNFQITFQVTVCQFWERWPFWGLKGRIPWFQQIPGLRNP